MEKPTFVGRFAGVSATREPVTSEDRVENVGSQDVLGGKAGLSHGLFWAEPAKRTMHLAQSMRVSLTTTMLIALNGSLSAVPTQSDNRCPCAKLQWYLGYYWVV